MNGTGAIKAIILTIDADFLMDEKGVVINLETVRSDSNIPFNAGWMP